MAKSAIILLSGGLDSALNMALCKEEISLALTINYGQKAASKEINAAKELTEYYQIPHKIIEIGLLKELTSGALLDTNEVPTITEEQLNNDIAYQHETAAKVWVPNRNGLFINIAASIAEANQLDKIFVGFNAEEAQTFSDNSEAFLKAINSSLSFSTRNQVEVFSETIHMTKQIMVSKALEIGLPLDKIWSCYHGGEKPCQTCESCMRFQRAYRSVTGVDYAY